MTASNILKENYINALYRRNNQGKPCVWYISKIPKSDVAVEDYYKWLENVINEDMFKDKS